MEINRTFVNLLELSRAAANQEDENESIITAKVTTMVVLFCVSMLCGMIPFKLAKWFKWTENNQDAKSSLLVSLLLSFGGGALLCTVFQHLLPEVNGTIKILTAMDHMPKMNFSLGEFLLCSGFFIIYLIEELVHLYLHRQERKMKEAASKMNELEVAGGAFMRGTNARESVILRKSINGLHNGSISTADLISNDLENQKRGIPVTEQDKPAITSGHPHDHHVHHHLPPADPEGSIVSALRGLLIVLALSIHELFEGLAVGLEGSTTTVWYMFGAVAAHKFVIAFCVGVELIVARTKFWLAVTYIFTYSVVSAIGIGIGILMSNGPNAADMEVISVILQGIASGTLLYVIFFEVLSKERSGLLQYLAVFIGFFFVFGIMLATE